MEIDWIEVSKIIFTALITGIVSGLTVYITFSLGIKRANAEWNRNRRLEVLKTQLSGLQEIIQDELYFSPQGHPDFIEISVSEPIYKSLRDKILKTKILFIPESQTEKLISRLLELINTHIPDLESDIYGRDLFAIHYSPNQNQEFLSVFESLRDEANRITNEINNL